MTAGVSPCSPAPVKQKHLPGVVPFTSLSVSKLSSIWMMLG